MIPFADSIDKPILSRLDANGSDAYDLNLDRIRAVNGAQYQLIAAVNSIMEKTKMVGEGLVDLNRTGVFQTSQFGQVAIDDLIALAPVNQKMWTILAVYPEFQSTDAQTIVVDPIATNSLMRLDVRFVKAIRSAKRWTQEQQAGVELDIFAPGNTDITTPQTKDYGYTYGTTPLTNTGQAPSKQLTILGGPASPARQLVAVAYLKEPSLVPAFTSELDPNYSTYQMEWPPSMAELLIAVALRILAIKTGDGTTQYGLNSQEMGMLLQAIA